MVWLLNMGKLCVREEGREQGEANKDRERERYMANICIYVYNLYKTYIIYNIQFIIYIIYNIVQYRIKNF